VERKALNSKCISSNKSPFPLLRLKVVSPDKSLTSKFQSVKRTVYGTRVRHWRVPMVYEIVLWNTRWNTKNVCGLRDLFHQN